MTDGWNLGPFMTLVLGVLALLAPPTAYSAGAQERPAPAAELAAG